MEEKFRVGHPQPPDSAPQVHAFKHGLAVDACAVDLQPTDEHFTVQQWPRLQTQRYAAYVKQGVAHGVAHREVVKRKI